MARIPLNIGSSPDDHTGDPLRTSLSKIEANTIDLYTSVGNLQGAVAGLGGASGEPAPFTAENASGALTLSAPTTGGFSNYELTLTGDVVLTLTGGGTGLRAGINATFHQDNVGGHSITYASGMQIAWPENGGQVLIGSDPGARTNIVYSTVTAGASWDVFNQPGISKPFLVSPIPQNAFARPARDVINGMGVCGGGHPAFSDAAPSTYASGLEYLGFRIIRGVLAEVSQSNLRRVQAIRAAQIAIGSKKPVQLYALPMAYLNDLTPWTFQAPIFRQALQDGILWGISGPNEINNPYTGSGSRGPNDGINKTADAALLTANKLDWCRTLLAFKEANSKDVLRTGTILGGFSTSPMLASGDYPSDGSLDLSRLVDFPDIHFYAGSGYQPSYPFGFNPGIGYFGTVLGWAQAAYGKRQYILSECGATTNGTYYARDGISQGKYMLNQAAEAFSTNAKAMMIYQLYGYDANSQDPEANYGLFFDIGQPKPAAVALRRKQDTFALNYDVNDDANFSDDEPFVYPWDASAITVVGLTTPPNTGPGYYTYFRSDGSAIIEVWNEPPIDSGGVSLSVPDNDVTVYLDKARPWRIIDPMAGIATPHPATMVSPTFAGGKLAGGYGIITIGGMFNGTASTWAIDGLMDIPSLLPVNGTPIMMADYFGGLQVVGGAVQVFYSSSYQGGLATTASVSGRPAMAAGSFPFRFEGDGTGVRLLIDYGSGLTLAASNAAPAAVLSTCIGIGCNAGGALTINTNIVIPTGTENPTVLNSGSPVANFIAQGGKLSKIGVWGIAPPASTPVASTGTETGLKAFYPLATDGSDTKVYPAAPAINSGAFTTSDTVPVVLNGCPKHIEVQAPPHYNRAYGDLTNVQAVGFTTFQLGQHSLGFCANYAGLQPDALGTTISPPTGQTWTLGNNVVIFAITTTAESPTCALASAKYGPFTASSGLAITVFVCPVTNAHQGFAVKGMNSFGEAHGYEITPFSAINFTTVRATQNGSASVTAALPAVPSGCIGLYLTAMVNNPYGNTASTDAAVIIDQQKNADGNSWWVYNCGWSGHITPGRTAGFVTWNISNVYGDDAANKPITVTAVITP